jgi:hypothetical protein
MQSDDFFNRYTKRFGGVRVLHDVSFAVQPGHTLEVFHRSMELGQFVFPQDLKCLAVLVRNTVIVAGRPCLW